MTLFKITKFIFQSLVFIFYSSANADTYSDLTDRNLIYFGEHPKLHLGCGEVHKNGYINIDFPMDNRPLHLHEAADYYSDILKLQFSEGVINTIENHHMFEHFSRPISIALLCAWHYWLENEGELVIETPDFANGIKRYLKEQSFEKKQVIIRHLYGSQEASWALHWDGWSKDKFIYILNQIGFNVSSIRCFNWQCLDNIEVIAHKKSQLSIEDLKNRGKEILKLSMVDNTPSEVLMWQGWCNEFEKYLNQMILRTNTFMDLIPENAVIFDVGAHTGEKTESFLKLSPKTVLAIEPQSSCLQILNKKFSKNPYVKIIPNCLNNHEGPIEINICSDAPTLSTCSNHWNQGRFSNQIWDKKEMVQGTTLDILIEEYGMPDYCKIDVEGFEYSVLKGLTRPIPLISIEYTKEFLEETAKIISYLESLGMTEFNFTIGENPSFYLKTFTDGESLIEKLSNIPEKLLWGDIYARHILKQQQ